MGLNATNARQRVRCGITIPDTKDLVHTYMWFLIAGEQITQAKNHVNQSMTMEQLPEAEQRAAEWIRKTRKIPPSSSIENPPNASTA